MHWEFIPFWIKTMEQVQQARRQGIPWLNASSEKLLESKMFRDAALKRRCLVLASHFFEWRSFKTVLNLIIKSIFLWPAFGNLLPIKKPAKPWIPLPL